jgi:hypothetical protein
LREVRVRESMGLLPLLTKELLPKELLPLSHRSDKTGSDLFSPHLQVQGGIKTT